MDGASLIEDRDATLKSMWESGFSVPRIAAEMGISPFTVHYHAQRLGLPRRTPVSQKIELAKCRRMWDAGYTQTSIAATFGVSGSAVRDFARVHDFPPRAMKKERPREVIHAAPSEPKDALLDIRRPAGWTFAMDCLVLKTEGRYRELAEIEAAHGLRAGSGWRRWVQIKDA